MEIYRAIVYTIENFEKHVLDESDFMDDKQDCIRWAKDAVHGWSDPRVRYEIETKDSDTLYIREK